MQLAEVLNLLHDLPRGDKLRAAQFLAADLTDEAAGVFVPDAEYAIWSPHDANEAACVLTELLAIEAKKP